MRSLVDCLVYSVLSQAPESVFYNYCNELDRFEKLAISCIYKNEREKLPIVCLMGRLCL